MDSDDAKQKWRRRLGVAGCMASSIVAQSTRDGGGAVATSALLLPQSQILPTAIYPLSSTNYFPLEAERIPLLPYGTRCRTVRDGGGAVATSASRTITFSTLNSHVATSASCAIANHKIVNHYQLPTLEAERIPLLPCCDSRTQSQLTTLNPQRLTLNSRCAVETWSVLWYNVRLVVMVD